MKVAYLNNGHNCNDLQQGPTHICIKTFFGNLAYECPAMNSLSCPHALTRAPSVITIKVSRARRRPNFVLDRSAVAIRTYQGIGNSIHGFSETWRLPVCCRPFVGPQFPTVRRPALTTRAPTSSPKWLSQAPQRDPQGHFWNRERPIVAVGDCAPPAPQRMILL